MPDFELHLTATPAYGTALVAPWIDAAVGALPSRLNPVVGRTMNRFSVTVGDPVSLYAIVGGVDGPLDTALDDRLFVCSCVESPLTYPVVFTLPTAGRSSVQQFTPTLAGHYLVYMRRPGGGKWFVHIDAREAA